MSTGRPPIKTPDIVDVEAALDHPRAETALTMARYDAQSEQQRILNDVLALGSDIGIVNLARIQKNISAVAEIKAFERINKSKAFRHIEIPGPDGVPRLAENIDDFCRVVFGGRGYKAMSDQKQMLDNLGEETYESATRIGLNRAQLRLLINLPEDTRSAVEEAMQAGSKSDVVTLIQSLANQLDEAKAKAEELKFEVAAKEDVLSTRSAQINALEEKLARVKTLPADEVKAELQSEATAHLNDTRGALIGKFSAAIAALFEHAETTGTEPDIAFMAGLVGQLQADLGALCDRFGIPDIAPALIPEWINDPAFKSLAE